MPRAEPAPDCWIHPDLVVASSKIAGDGLLAKALLAAGTVALRFASSPGSVVELDALNHSCDPTAWWADDLTLVARRDIGVGEELTIDYSTSTAVADFVMMCHCQTYRCRQLIAGDDWQIPQLQRRYVGHWTADLQSLIDGNL